MDTPFDPAKDEINRRKHGISLARAGDLDAIAFAEDDRFDYGEVRYRAWGLIDGVPYCLAYTMRDGVPRPVSLRRAHAREMNRHAR